MIFQLNSSLLGLDEFAETFDKYPECVVALYQVRYSFCALPFLPE
jgi:hypothetical protein